ncbi:SWIM zinc finger family protein [Streptomyces gibsoniae]
MRSRCTCSTFKGGFLCVHVLLPAP